jgi:hypothetical protein
VRPNEYTPYRHCIIKILNIYFNNIKTMGFFNKPFKATKGFVNKVVREVDRVAMTSGQFQNEYGTPQAASAPAPAPAPPAISVDPEFPEYAARNKQGLILPLAQYYKQVHPRFIIFVDDASYVKGCKASLNGMMVIRGGYNDTLEDLLNDILSKFSSPMYKHMIGVITGKIKC